VKVHQRTANQEILYIAKFLQELQESQKRELEYNYLVTKTMEIHNIGIYHKYRFLIGLW